MATWALNSISRHLPWVLENKSGTLSRLSSSGHWRIERFNWLVKKITEEHGDAVAHLKSIKKYMEKILALNIFPLVSPNCRGRNALLTPLSWWRRYSPWCRKRTRQQDWMSNQRNFRQFYRVFQERRRRHPKRHSENQKNSRWFSTNDDIN